jgi:hypothetical protein
VNTPLLIIFLHYIEVAQLHGVKAVIAPSLPLFGFCDISENWEKKYKSNQALK